MLLFDNKEEYLDVLKNQIRNSRARNTVAKEIENHIEDQMEAYIELGDNEHIAMEKALEQMGNPEEIGKQLDKVHRPRFEWRLLLLVFSLCLSGVIIQLSLRSIMKDAGIPYSFNITRQILFILTGFILMSLVYFMDYTILGKYPKLIWFLMVSICIIYSLFGKVVNGRVIHLSSIVMLLMPLYGGIVYAYRKKGYAGIIKCILISIITLLVEIKFVAQTNVSAGFLLSCLIILSIAVKKDWFGTSKLKSFLLIWGWPFVMLFLGLLTGIHILSPYQEERIKFLFNFLFIPGNYGYSYPIDKARQTLFQAKLFGQSSGFQLGKLPNLNTDYILTYIIGRFGIAAAIMLIVIFIFLFIRLLRLSLKQKNTLGMFIGIGCSMVFMTMGVNYILANLSLQFLAQVNLPFVSYGGVSVIINFIVLGIILSVIRNTNLIRETPYEQRFSVSVKINVKF